MSTIETPKYVGRTYDDLLSAAEAAVEREASCGDCFDGTVEETYDCSDCDGMGYYADDDGDDSESETCTNCNGDGTVTEDEDCSVCYGMTDNDGETIERIRPILRFLADLSTYGFQTMAADWCCGGCSGAAATDGIPWIGFHEQAIEADRIRRGDKVHLFHALGFTDEETRANTELVHRLADKHGLTLDWDGSDARTIAVVLPE